MRYNVRLSARAVRDLNDARDYIAQFAPDTAQKWYASFLQGLSRLESHPEICPLAPEDSRFNKGMRQMLFRTRSRLANRVLFVVVDDEVRVLAVRRPGQPLADLQDLE